jgi:predicted nuclease of restriction endonuclease-like RecB superfamily
MKILNNVKLNGGYGHKHRTLNGTLLRSDLEKRFYDLLIAKGFVEHRDFEIGKRYPNSALEYDFYLIHQKRYIEIAGMHHKEYKTKLDVKLNVFDAFIIYRDDDFEEKLRELLND